MDCIMEYFSLETLTSVLNSSFTLGLIGTGLGAWAGATAAQNTAEKSKLRTEFQDQIRNTNTAITLSFMVFNSAVSLKTQFSKDMVDNYFKSMSDMDIFLAKREAGEIGKNQTFDFTADLRHLPALEFPMNALQAIVYEKLSVKSRPLSLIATLASTLSALANIITTRNKLIDDFRNLDPTTRDKRFPALYFGRPYEGGHINAEYLDAMKGLRNLNDDIIFFSSLLLQDLTTYGNSIMTNYESVFDDVNEKVTSIILAPDSTGEIRPTDINYQSWVNWFDD